MPKRSLDQSPKPSTSNARSSSSLISSVNDEEDDELQKLLYQQFESAKRPHRSLPKQLCESYKAVREAREKYIDESRRSSSSSNEEREKPRPPCYRRRSLRCSTTPTLTDAEKSDRPKKIREVLSKNLKPALSFWTSSSDSVDAKTGSAEKKTRCAVEAKEPEKVEKSEEGNKAKVSDGATPHKIECLECESSDCTDEDPEKNFAEKQNIEKIEKPEDIDVNDNDAVEKPTAVEVQDTEKPREVAEITKTETIEAEGDIKLEKEDTKTDDIDGCTKTELEECGEPRTEEKSGKPEDIDAKDNCKNAVEESVEVEARDIEKSKEVVEIAETENIEIATDETVEIKESSKSKTENIGDDSGTKVEKEDTKATKTEIEESGELETEENKVEINEGAELEIAENVSTKIEVVEIFKQEDKKIEKLGDGATEAELNVEIGKVENKNTQDSENAGTETAGDGKSDEPDEIGKEVKVKEEDTKEKEENDAT